MSEVFFCRKILRYLPQRRIVIAGRWHEQEVVGKFFLQQEKSKDLKREKFGIRALKNVSIPKANLLQEKKCADFYVLLYEKINAEGTLGELWASRTLSQKQFILESLIKIFAQLHQQQLIHTDPHMNNILYQNEKIYLLDYGAIQSCKFFFKKLMLLRNLALLLAQFPRDIFLFRDLFHLYCQQMGFSYSAFHQKLFSCLLIRHFSYRRKKFEKKIFRQCQLVQFFDKKPHAYGFYLRAKKNQILPLLSKLDELLGHSSTQLLKNGNSATVGLVYQDNLALVIKRHNIKNLWHFVRRACRKSRAHRSWRCAHLLKFYQLPTVTPLAWVQCKKWGFNHKSYFICEYLNGSPAPLYIENLNTATQKHEAISKIKSLVKKLHQSKICHNDLKLTNIIFVNNEPYFLDLDACTTHHFFNKVLKRYEKDNARLLKNWTKVDV